MDAGRQLMRGFSLLEMLIAAAIAGLLAAAALPSYHGYVLRAQRAVAKAALLEIAARQEEFLVEHKRYSGSLSAWYPVDARGEVSLQRDGSAGNAVTRDAIYRVGLAADDLAYVLEATPVNAQAADHGCDVLRYESAGARSASGPLGPGCWR